MRRSTAASGILVPLVLFTLVRSRQLFLEVEQEQPPFRSDLLIVMPSSAARSAIIQSTQKARRGVRTLVVTDQGPALNGNAVAKKQLQLRISRRAQVFGAYKESTSQQHSKGNLELRIALAPFLANLTIGASNYKWLLFGHDDTLWMVDNVLKLLEGLDHDHPYLITDNVWFADGSQGSTSVHPHEGAPLCLLCRSKGYTDIGMHKEGGRWKCILNEKEAPQSCLCQRKALAANSTWEKLFSAETLDFRDQHQKTAFQVHLGAGVVMSRGLLSSESFERIHSWMKAQGSGSADALFTSVMWDLLGVMPSKPGYDQCRPGMTVFDPGWKEPRRRAKEDRGHDAGNDPLGVKLRLDSAINDDGVCDKGCQLRLDKMVSVHVRQRFAAEDLSPAIPGAKDTAPRFNATVTLLRTLTQQYRKLQSQKWAQEQSFLAAGN